MPSPIEELSAETRRLRIEAIAEKYGVPVDLIDPPPKINRDTANIAQRHYDWRMLNGIPGDAVSDWRAAEQYIAFANYRLELEYKPVSPEEAQTKAHFASQRMGNQEVRKVRKFLMRRLTSMCRLFIPSEEIRANVGCGVSAISTLTGEYPPLLNEMYPTKLISPAEMCLHLTKNGFEVTEIGDRWLNPSDHEHIDFITERHLLLVSFRAAREQNSWGIIWGDQLFHNYERTKLRTTRMLGRVLNLYLLWRPVWVDDVQAMYNTLCLVQPEGAPELDEDLEATLAGKTPRQFAELLKTFREEK